MINIRKTISVLFTFFVISQCAFAQTIVTTEAELTAAVLTDNAQIQFANNIDIANLLEIKGNRTITIDMNGFTLDRGCTSRGSQVIVIRNGSTLNLSNGTLTGGWGGNGGALDIETNTTVNLTDVIITGNTADDRGGGISNHGTLNMQGGSITNNNSNDKTAPRGGGGIFNYEGATTTLTNVIITGNMTTAGFGGGGICNHGTLTIDGGSITGNTAGTHGGGIWTDGTLNIQGALVVKDNLRADGVKDNLHLTSGKLLTLIGAITDSDIRVNMENPGVFTSGYATYHSGTHPSQILIPDFLPYWGVSQNSDGEACLTPQKEGSVSFIERSWDDVNKKVVCTRRVWEAGEYVVLTPTDDFYLCSHTKILVRGDVTFEYTLLINTTDPVTIVLADNSHLQVPAIVGRKGYYDMSLSIYAEEGGGTLGRITSCVPHDSENSETAGIGAWKNNTTAVTIHGGNIYADGGNFAPGIGSVNGSQDRAGADITIYGGNITAIGGSGSAGIGGGYDVPNYGNIRIYGGTISAQGGRALGYTAASSGPGIGGGHNCTGGTTHIYGGDITAVGTYEGAGIGSSQTSDSETGAGHIIIDGGNIVARGDDYAAGIGGGDGVNGNKIEINGGEVYAYGGKDAAGIGGGEGGDGGTITITGGYVYAQGGTDYGAGIGGGENGDGGNITITGGTVIAKAGKNDTGLRAIGPGAGSDNYGTLTLGDQMMVSSERLATAAERKGFCWYRTQARIEPCTHPGATYTDSGSSISIGCSYCLKGTMPYTFNANGNWNDDSKWLFGFMPHDGNDVAVKADATIPADCCAHVGNITIDGGSITIADGGQLIHSNEGVTATTQKNIGHYTVDSGAGTANGWYFITSPLSGGYTPDAIMLSNTYDLYRLNNTIWENWKQSGDHHHFHLENSRGYLYANSEDVTLEFTGTVLPSANSKNVSVNAGFNLIGNPFLHDVYADRAYYRMNDERTGIVAVENYQENPITPCTGVIVNADAAGTVTFSKEAPSLSNNNGSLQITLAKVSNNRDASTRSAIAQDNAIVSFNAGTTLPKFRYSENAEIYIPQEGDDYAIAYSDRTGEMPLHFKAQEMGQYTVTFDSDDLNGIKLVDKFEGVTVDLGIENSYTFIGSPVDSKDRFIIRFGNAESSEPSGSFAYQSGSDIIVSGEGELQVFDVMGRMVMTQRVNGVETVEKPSQTGVYIFRLNEMTQKIVIR